MKKIARLNDRFRRTFLGGKIVISIGVHALPDTVKAAALVSVATYTGFTEENDPHGEHDFGRFRLYGEDFCWKVDYFDAEFKHASEDPSDPKKTGRVLTVMLCREY
jgi:Protein of unknown function (DUF3768)